MQTPSLPPLCKAAFAGDTSRLKTLLKRAPDVHAAVMQRLAPAGITPLHSASFGGSAPCVKLLLSMGHLEQQVMARTERGANALIFAATEGHHSVVKALIDAAGGAYAAAQCQLRDT
jgi:ankyrin repeat protein